VDDPSAHRAAHLPRHDVTGPHVEADIALDDAQLDVSADDIQRHGALVAPDPHVAAGDPHLKLPPQAVGLDIPLGTIKAHVHPGRHGQVHVHAAALVRPQRPHHIDLHGRRLTPHLHGQGLGLALRLLDRSRPHTLDGPQAQVLTGGGGENHVPPRVADDHLLAGGHRFLGGGLGPPFGKAAETAHHLKESGSERLSGMCDLPRNVVGDGLHEILKHGTELLPDVGDAGGA